MRILEYSEKLIQTTIERFKQQNPTLDDDVARQLINRFDQIKSSLSQKLNTLNLPDNLKQNNRFLDITLYTLDDLVKLLRSLPENDDKVKKEAIKMFMDKERLEKSIVQSYISRFMDRRRDLKYAVENGSEDGNMDKKEVQALIPPRLIQNQLYLDPRNWPFIKLEQMLDALFPRLGQVEDGDDINTASTDGDKVYEKDGIEVYKGDAQHKCVSHNPTEGGRKKYSWCIAQPGNSNYDYYRFQNGTNRMFYFVFDRSLPDSDDYHAFVIHVGEDNKKYWVTNARNSGDRQVDSWKGIGSVVPPSVWKKIQGLESVFKYIPPSKAEISSAALRGKKLSGADFNELDYDTKEQYIQSNAGTLGNDILNILDVPLKNLAINYGQKFNFAQLKANEGLAKRYAVFRFRHTNYSKEPIPLPFVKYLDEPAKEKYLETFDNNLTFEYLDKFFGNEISKKYVDRELSSMGYLPKSAEKYMDPKQKTLFEAYSQFFKEWKYPDNTNMSDEKLEMLDKMPEQIVNPYIFSLESWKELDKKQQSDLLKILDKANSNSEKYNNVLYGSPLIIKYGEKNYMLIPTTGYDFKDLEYKMWSLVDLSTGKVISNNVIGDKSSVKGQEISYGIFGNNIDNMEVDSKDVKLNSQTFDNFIEKQLSENEFLFEIIDESLSLKEIEEADFAKQMKLRAGLIK